MEKTDSAKARSEAHYACDDDEPPIVFDRKARENPIHNVPAIKVQSSPYRFTFYLVLTTAGVIRLPTLRVAFQLTNTPAIARLIPRLRMRFSRSG